MRLLRAKFRALSYAECMEATLFYALVLRTFGRIRREPLLSFEAAIVSYVLLRECILSRYLCIDRDDQLSYIVRRRTAFLSFNLSFKLSSMVKCIKSTVFFC